MDAVLYLRYSSQNQNEFSIEGQRECCKEYCRSKNYNIVGEYIDRCRSAKTDNRPEFKRMIKDSSKQEFNAVIVYQFDRFARNRSDSVIYKGILKKNNVSVISAKENINDDASGILMESLLDGMSEYYSYELAQKVTRGMKTNASKFYYNGGSVPLGLKLEAVESFQSASKMRSKKRFAIDEESAPIVKKIFKKFDNGESMIDIIQYLNKLGYKTSQNKEFNKNSIRRILENKKYIGTYSYDGIETPDIIPSIISKDLFERVQHKLTKYRCAPGRQKAKTNYLLTTKLFCGYCESMLIGSAGTSRNGILHNYYICKNKKNGCKKKSAKKNLIEDVVVDMAREVLTDKTIPIIAKNVIKYAEKNDLSELKQLKQTMITLEKQKNNLTNSLKNCDVEIVRNTIIEELTKIETKKCETMSLIKEEEKNNAYIEYDKVLYFFEQMKNGNINDEIYRQRLVNCFINKVFLWDDKIIVTFNINKDEISIKLPELQDLVCSFEVTNGVPINVNKTC